MLHSLCVCACAIQHVLDGKDPVCLMRLLTSKLRVTAAGLMGYLNYCAILNTILYICCFGQCGRMASFETLCFKGQYFWRWDEHQPLNGWRTSSVCVCVCYTAECCWHGWSRARSRCQLDRSKQHQCQQRSKEHWAAFPAQHALLLVLLRVPACKVSLSCAFCNYIWICIIISSQTLCIFHIEVEWYLFHVS